jgi:hypothetical protein
MPSRSEFLRELAGAPSSHSCASHPQRVRNRPPVRPVRRPGRAPRPRHPALARRRRPPQQLPGAVRHLQFAQRRRLTASAWPEGQRTDKLDASCPNFPASTVLLRSTVRAPTVPRHRTGPGTAFKARAVARRGLPRRSASQGTRRLMRAGGRPATSSARTEGYGGGSETGRPARTLSRCSRHDHCECPVVDGGRDITRSPSRRIPPCRDPRRSTAFHGGFTRRSGGVSGVRYSRIRIGSRVQPAIDDIHASTGVPHVEPL